MDTIGTVHDIHAAATALTGLTDFGPPDYHEGLDVILAAYQDEADLTPLGVAMARDELRDILVARLFSEAGWRRHPEYAEVLVERPVFIVGMPRTGTTTLHRLLTADPAHQGLELWLGAAPRPRPPLPTWAKDPIFQLVQGAIHGFLEQNPGYLGIHNRDAAKVEECWLLTRQSMLSAFFEFTGHVPTYSNWLAEQDWTAAYERHRRNLQLIGLPTPGRTWILKYSGHLLCLDALLATYPDALIVHTHRRPASTVLGSACSMVSRLAAGKSTSFRGDAIGPALLELAERALTRFAADRARHDQDHFHDVEFDDFTADPHGVVAGIYARLGRPVTEPARAAMAEVLAEDDRLRSHRYDLAEFGVTAEQADARLAALV
ncbi:sulfotransferase [Frankia sp. AgB32]|uniref:sulfotransferase family protein n=1 Tax=Frankia sp. AgB32 TaxID=631119 RepID=UPI00200ECD84|nr:sulfotransferase [Frankia sp. AgB32]MCK9897336.1 sulfotransferase [Frankia sp. AgB32]